MQKITEKREDCIDKFIDNFSEEQCKCIFRKANESNFLIGNNDRGWKADFDFLMRIDKATQVLEGKYDNKKNSELSDFAKMWKKAKEEEENEQNGNDTSYSLPS